MLRTAKRNDKKKTNDEARPPKSSSLGRFCPINFGPFFTNFGPAQGETKRRPRKPENSNDEARKPETLRTAEKLQIKGQRRGKPKASDLEDAAVRKL